MRKQMLSIVLSLCMVLALMPQMAFAEGSVTYLDADGTLKTSTSTTEVTGSDTEWTGTTTNPGWYVVNTNVTIGTEDNPQRVTVSGDVRLILADGCTLTVNGGIQVQDNSTGSTPNTNALTIYGQSDPLLNEDGTLAENNRTGVLIAHNVTGNNAAIGGNEGNEGTGYIGGAGGKITINSGVVKATGGVNGAAIGGGSRHRGGDGGTITINGGSVIATGGINGAAIGGGYGGGYGGSGGEITITGGSVIATGQGGAAIGGGGGNGDGGSGGKITITGGSVIATGSRSGAAIGGGYGGGPGGSGGNVTITGGTVNATSTGRGVAIGGGDGGFGIGGGGTFETTGNGNAVIFASSIVDQSHKDDWSGIVVVGNEGEVYGSSVTPIEDFTIENGKTLNIHSGKTLIIPKGVTLTIAVGGTLNNNGTLYVDGTLSGTAAGSEYYRLTVNGGTATGSAGMETHDEKTYVKAGSEITLTPDTPPTGYSFDKWVVLSSSVTVNANNSFTMPSTPLEITVQWKDIENPVITGLENAKTYCYEQTVTVSDNIGIASVTVNGTLVPLDANNQFTLKPADVVQEVVATDNAGNKTTVTVTVNNGHTAANDDGDCVTPVCCIYHPDTVVVAAKSHNFSGEWNKDENGHWHTCQNGGCTVAETKTFHSGTDDGDCTTAVICKCGYTVVAANAKHSYGEWQSNGNGTRTRYCTIDGCNGYEDGKNSIEGKVTVTPKLPHEMLEGTGQSLTAGEKKELTFKSNAAFSDFIRVELDGKTLDEKNYTVKEGSTVVTLKADYVATLSAGEHTIGIVSTSGTAATTFTVNAKTVVNDDTNPDTGATTSPQTEDNSSLTVWFALLAVSAVGVMGAGVYRKRRGSSRQK